MAPLPTLPFQIISKDRKARNYLQALLFCQNRQQQRKITDLFLMHIDTNIFTNLLANGIQYLKKISYCDQVESISRMVSCTKIIKDIITHQDNEG